MVLVTIRLKSKFPKRRQAATILSIRHLQDKSSIVRKYAIRVLTTLISTHPYSMYGGELNLEDWNARLLTLRTEIEVISIYKYIHLICTISSIYPSECCFRERSRNFCSD